MNQHDANDNSAIFDRSPRFREEASRSWWLESSSREAFQQAAIRERLRMSRSREAKHVSGTFIVGMVGRGK